MKRIGHVMILASAGSGKTHALTNRFVALLAQGAPPEKIVALTFTRKAAGEFFDEILHKLARAAEGPANAAQLATAISQPQLQAEDFRQLLRAVIEAMPRLRLGTLDSFFARVARIFPLELGLAGDFEIMQEHAARLERRRVLRRLFTRAGELAAPQKDFVEAFKRATFGSDEKQLGRRLDGFLDDHQEHFLAAPASGLWGESAQIWPRGAEWLAAASDVNAARGALRAWVANAALADKPRERWLAFLDVSETWMPGVLPNTRFAYVLEKALAAWPDLLAGRAVLEFDRKKQELSVEACAALVELVRHVISGELQRRLATTRGIYAVVQGYEAVYHEAVRRAGKLTFGDVQRLLMPRADGPLLTRRGEVRRTDEENEAPHEAVLTARLFVDFRLDAEIDHWLLDEFQDTSHGQWSVLRNLVDEVVQDPSGARTFFCVGDIKQAIFTWREGDPRLFHEILDHYNAHAPATIAEESLVDSWRSGPALIEMVNAVFGADTVFTELFPGRAAAAWNKAWRPHVSAVPTRFGQAALLHAPDEAGRWALALQLLQEIRPLERGLTCAILVRSNAVAGDLADYLRREGGLPTLAESDLHVCTDNPLGAALLALAQAAAHPGDTFAWQHVQMTPLASGLAADGVATPEALTRRVLGQIHEGGFQRMVEFWLQRLEPSFALDDAFTRERGRQFTAAAGMFDASGSREVAEFVQFMQRHTVREAESAAVIRVMTIHKSKGLGFDVVLLPDLEGERIDQRRGGLAVQKAADRTIQWVLDLPPKLFWQRDDVLTKHVREAEAEACYEAISLLYVAMTRAKRAMYVITKPPGTSTSRNFPRILAATLGTDEKPIRVGALPLVATWAEGDPDWHTKLTAPVAIDLPAEKPVLLSEVAANRVIRRAARRPSSAKTGSISAAQIFALDQAAGADFGLLVHTLFDQVEWLENGTVVALKADWEKRGIDLEARSEALACLEAPQLASLWQRPAGRKVEVWRERAFEVVLDDVWITGVFDRVVVVRDAAGRVEQVVVIDFKTDRVTDEASLQAAAKRHAGQLNVYRRVASVLTQTRLATVRCDLVFTRSRRVVTVLAAVN